MASRRHDFIVSALARKIRILGYQVYYLDGRYQEVGTNKIDIPPTIINHRPDVIGINGISFVIGEAKTESDIAASRTKRQITDFFTMLQFNKDNRLILGVPLKSKEHLQSIIKALGFASQPQIEILCVPEDILPDENETDI